MTGNQASTSALRLRHEDPAQASASTVLLKSELKLLHTQCHAIEQELKASAFIGQQLLQHNQELRQKVQSAAEKGVVSLPVSPIFDLPHGQSFAHQLRSADESREDGNEHAAADALECQAEGAPEETQSLADRVQRLQACLSNVVEDWNRWEVGVSGELHQLSAEVEAKSNTASDLQKELEESQGEVQALHERFSELESELEDERAEKNELHDRIDELEQKNRQTMQEAEGERLKRRNSQTELLGVVEDSDAAHRRLESDMLELKARLGSEEEQNRQLQNRIAELEEKLGEAMADGARYHCQLVQTRQSLFDTQAQLQEVQEKPGLTVKGRQVSDESKDFDGPQDESSAMRSLESRGDAASFLEEASAEAEAQDERIDELQSQLQDANMQLEASETKCAQMEVQHVEAENLIKDLQARLRAQGAAHVADLEYLADAEARASALVTAAADALKAKDMELNQLRERLAAAKMASSSSNSSLSSNDDGPPQAGNAVSGRTTRRNILKTDHSVGASNLRRVEPGQSGPARPKAKAAGSSHVPKSSSKSEEPVWI